MVDRYEIPSESTTSQAPEPAPAATPAAAQPAPAEPVAPVAEPQATPAAPAAPERPVWLDPKFSDGQAMAKAYAELERKQAQSVQTPPAEGAAPAEGAEGAPAPEAQEQLRSVGIDDAAMARYGAEVATNGGLSEASYLELQEDLGIPRNLVDGFIQGQQALAQNYQSALLEEAGGQEAYTEMGQWAAANWSPEEIAAFDAAVSSNDVSRARFAIKGLQAGHTAATGGVQAELLAGGPPVPINDAFASWAEVTAAMSDPRYKSDAAYNKAVEQKIGRSGSLEVGS